MSDLMIFAGNSNPEQAKKLCEFLEMKLGKALVSTFSNGEIQVEIGENVRGADVFVIQTGAPPVNHNLMELLVMIDALKRSSARRITAVMPCYSYARQDRKNKPRVPITARLVADLLETAGTKRVLTLDLHAGQIQGFFHIPVDNLYATPILGPYLQRTFNSGRKLVVVSPDAGGVPRARAYAKILNAELAMIDKRREEANKVEEMKVVGEDKVNGRVAILVDDMVDTAGTLCKAAQAILEKGAIEVHAAATHAVLSGPAIDRISASPIKSLAVTDSLPLSEAASESGKITVVPSFELLAKAIQIIHQEGSEECSISSLFEIMH